MGVLGNYPYLWATILATAVLLALIPMLESKRTAVFSGLLHAPAGIFGFTLVDYYTPQKLGGYLVGIEDILFGFASGLTVWLLTAPWPFARSLQVEWRMNRILRRVAVFSVALPPIYFAMWYAGADSLSPLLIALGLCGCFVLVRRRELWPLAIPAALTYPLVHGLATASAFAMWPDFSADWATDHFWGTRLLLQTPLGEIAWAAAFGASWPLVVAFLLDARPRASPTADRSA